MSTSHPNELVALVGAPNSGKTTLYNWLTNSNFKTVNFPGSTIDIAIGKSGLNPKIDFMDTPGAYSLFPKSMDEEVTVRALKQTPTGRTPVKMLVVVDSTQLTRNSPLIEQCRESQIPFVVVLTMTDLMKKANSKIDLQALMKLWGAPVVEFDGVKGLGQNDILESLNKTPLGTFKLGVVPWPVSRVEESLLKARKSIPDTILKIENSKTSKASISGLTKKIDSVLLHPFWGLFFFFAIMLFFFTSIYFVASPVMELLKASFEWAGTQILALSPNSLTVQFLSEGLIASFAAVLVFTPQIFILFFVTGLLESSGYLARASALVDRPFSAVGLSGRAFVPILSGFACAVPAMMATRNLSSSRDRWIANAILPLMTCSARLPVYSLLLGMIFAGQAAWKPGMALAGIYLMSIAIGALAAGILAKLVKIEEKSLLMIDLPLYRRPRLQQVFIQSLKRTKSYIVKAGPTILIIAVLIWVGSHFPLQNDNDQLKTSEITESYLGRFGKFIEPVFAPMGADWRIGIGLISAFSAREVFVSTLAIVFKTPESEEQTELTGALSSASFNDKPLFNFASIGALILFFMIALQCMSTFAVAVQESGSKKFAWGQLITFNLIAYICAVAFFQAFKNMG